MSFFVVNGNLWVWGSNWAGQLGLDDATMIKEPRMANWDSTRKIKRVLGGGNHTLILTEDNEIWVAGRGNEGSLGLGEAVRENNVSAWTKIEFFEKNGLSVKSLSTGFGHSVAITEDDKVYVWGNNEQGQLGLGDNNNRFEPTLVEYFTGRGVRGVTCGQLHTVVWGDYSIL